MIERAGHVQAPFVNWPVSQGMTTQSVYAEAAIAIVFEGRTEAVVMASPTDLQDFAFGYALNQGIISKLSQLRLFDIAEVKSGLELRLWLQDTHRDVFQSRRQVRGGVLGLAQSGVVSITQAMRSPSHVPANIQVEPSRLISGMEQLTEMRRTGEHNPHAAAFLNASSGVLECLREDIGRLNAVDKLSGALARAGVAAAKGVLFTTGRICAELIRRSAAMGSPAIVGMFPPTALALSFAEDAGICVAACSPNGELEVFTCLERLARP